MDNRKWEADAIASPPTAPASPSSGYPTNGNPAAAQNATEPGAWWFHAVGEELRAVIAAGGLTPNHTTLTQVRDAINALIASNIQTVPDATETVKGKAEIATQAEVGAGTDDARFVTPLKLHTKFNITGSAPVYACRAWVNFNGTGTVAILASGNVTSITDNGTGDYTVNFTTAMPDVNYSATVSGARAAGAANNGGYATIRRGATSFATTSIRVAYLADNTTQEDPDNVCVAIFR